MSLTWRERLRRAKHKKSLMEKLGLTEEDWEFLEENILEFCRCADEQARLVEGQDCDVDKVEEEMDDWDFEEHTVEVLKEIFEKLGRKIGKKQKKKKKQENESEESEDAESDTESDAEADEVAESGFS